MGESRSRRNFLLRAAALSTVLPSAVLAQEPGRIYVIGMFWPSSRTPPGRPPLGPAAVKALARHGFTEGVNVRIEREFGNVPPEDLNDDARREAHLRAAASRLLARNPDVILAFGGAEVLKSLTRTIPIIFTREENVEERGLVKSLNRPGGNVTGVVVFYDEIAEKRIEFIRELLPNAKRAGFISNYAFFRRYWERDFPARYRAAARRLGLELIDGDVSAHGGDPDATFRTVLASRPEAFMVFGTLVTGHGHLRTWPEYQRLHRIPYIGDGSSAKGVVNYGFDLEDHARRTWEMAVRMLKGARPEDTPVDRDTRFILTVDPKGAREIGIEIPASIMIRANVLVG